MRILHHHLHQQTTNINKQTPHTVSTHLSAISKRENMIYGLMKTGTLLAHTDIQLGRYPNTGNQSWCQSQLYQDDLKFRLKIAEDNSGQRQEKVKHGIQCIQIGWYHKAMRDSNGLLSHLEIHGAGVSTEDANQKFLRSLPSAWLQAHDHLPTANVAFVSENTTVLMMFVPQSSCPQLDHEDLDQVDEYDLEEMDFKMASGNVSMRIKSSTRKLGKCRTKEDNRRRDGWNPRNKDGSRTRKKEESKALVTVDGESVDWTTHSEDDENFAFMASNSSGSDTQVPSCSNECKESYANLKRLYDAQREKLSDASVEIKAYTQGLKNVEASLVAHQQAQKEKDDLDVIVDKCNHSSKNLGKIINHHMSASDKFGLGYGDYRYSGNLSYEILKDNPHRTLKNKGIIDSGCSRHMTGNKAYLADFQDFNGGPVAFGGSKGYITGKGKIKTGKLDFEDVSFVKELQHFNLFSVSQMCDKKNKVLFTDTECLVLSPDFKLPDENQILLKSPDKNLCTEVGHVNFKNLNRLVKGNLVEVYCMLFKMTTLVFLVRKEATQSFIYVQKQGRRQMKRRKFHKDFIIVYLLVFYLKMNPRMISEVLKMKVGLMYAKERIVEFEDSKVWILVRFALWEKRLFLSGTKSGVPKIRRMKEEWISQQVKVVISWQETHYLAMQKADHVASSTTESRIVPSYAQLDRYLEKTERECGVEFHEVIDFLRRSYIYHALTVSPVVSTTFVEQFWTSAKSKTINNVRHITAKVAGKFVSISEASIRTDLIFDDADGIDSLPNQAIFDAIQLMGYEGDLTDEGASLERLSDEQPSPSPTPSSEVPNESLPDSSSAQPSEVPYEQQPDPSPTPSPRPSPKPSPTPIVTDSIPEPSDQAKEIKLLKAKIIKLKMHAKPIIKHHKAYLKSVSLQQRFPRKSFSKVHKKNVSKQGRKKTKGESEVHRDPLFDVMPEDKIDQVETENA
ncbi:hypothetical protein Tco_0741364 [Tanacetum coccineum]